MRALPLVAILLFVCVVPALAQVPEARRLGMGGVLLSEVSQSSSQNVAYRAVPTGTAGLAGYSDRAMRVGSEHTAVQFRGEGPE